MSAVEGDQNASGKPPLPDPFLVWYHINKTDTFHLNTLSIPLQRYVSNSYLLLRYSYSQTFVFFYNLTCLLISFSSLIYDMLDNI